MKDPFINYQFPAKKKADRAESTRTSITYYFHYYLLSFASNTMYIAITTYTIILSRVFRFGGWIQRERESNVCPFSLFPFPYLSLGASSFFRLPSN